MKGKVQRPPSPLIILHTNICYIVPGVSKPPENTNASHQAGGGVLKTSESTPLPPPTPLQQFSTHPPPESLPKWSQQEVDEDTSDTNSTVVAPPKRQCLEKAGTGNRGKGNRTRGSQHGHGSSAIVAPRCSNRAQKSSVSNSHLSQMLYCSYHSMALPGRV